MGQSERASGLATALLWVQGIYFLITGVWRPVSIRTFQWVTVMTVGVLVTSIAVTLLTAGVGRRLPLELIVLAVGSALALTGIDVVYVIRGVIAPIYLVDAGIEVVLIAGWMVVIASRSRGTSQSSSDKPGTLR